MKKNILYIFAFILMVTTLNSCQDAIEIEQPGLLVSENAIRSVDDLELNINAIYGMLDNSSEIRFNALYTDEVFTGKENGGQGQEELSLILNPNSNFPLNLVRNDGNRKGYFIILSHVNRILESIESITPQVDEETRYNVVKGEAYAIRAYSHFILQTYLTTDYTDDNALGTILFDRVVEIGEELPRSTNGEVFNLISSDLDTAYNLLPVSGPVTRINKDFVIALKARMAAYRENYSDALTYANDLLSRYPLADTSTYQNMFNDFSDGECIFKLERTVNDNFDGQGISGGGWAGSLFAFVDPTFSGGPFLEMSRSLYAKYLPGDVRLTTFLNPTSVIDPNYQTTPNFIFSDVLLINKYPGSEGQPLMNDLKIFRASEMLLIKAEAEAFNNQLTDCALTLKTLRDARFGSSQVLQVFANQTEAFGAILDERRLEFAFEGFRWVDLKRLGEKGNRQIDRDARECAEVGACTLSNNDFRFTVPFPIQETDLNSLLEQNPGY